MRILFFNEGNLGTHVLGQSQLDEALRVGLSATPQVQARFAGLTPMGRTSRAAAIRPIPLLTRANLDSRALRWHLVQALRARRAVRHELRAWQADIVHVHSHSIALMMARTMRAVPVVLSLDTTVGDWWAMPAWRDRRRDGAIAPSMALERRALRQAALVLAWTDWARRAVEREAPEAHVVEHHPGIDLGRYRPAVHRARSRPRVLFVGGRFKEKGGEDLLEALGEDLGKSLDLDLVTPMQVADRPGLRVHRLTHSDPQLLDLLQQADVFCLPTHGDAAPWALLEAMACATPAISTRIGGIPDLLDGGRAGVLTTHGDRRALHETLHTLLADERRRSLLAAQARRRCEERYDARRQFARLVDRLEEISTHVRIGGDPPR